MSFYEVSVSQSGKMVCQRLTFMFLVTNPFSTLLQKGVSFGTNSEGSKNQASRVSKTVSRNTHERNKFCVRIALAPILNLLCHVNLERPTYPVVLCLKQGGKDALEVIHQRLRV